MHLNSDKVMKQLKNIIFGICLLFFVSCGGHKAYDSIIARADSLMEANPDSAQKALAMLDNLQSKRKEMRQSQLMRYELIYAKAMNKAFVDFKTDSVMKQVAAYYEQHGSAKDKMQAYYLLGCTYRDLKEAPASLDNYIKAVECVDTLEDKVNYGFLARVYGQMGDLYLKQSLPKNAMASFKQAQKYALQDKDTLTALIANEYLADAYTLLDDLDQTIAICDKTYGELVKHGYRKEAAQCLGASLQALLLKKQYKKFQRNMQIYEAESGFFDGNPLRSVGYAFHYYLKGIYYLNVQLDSAKIYLEKSQSFADGLLDKYNCVYGWYQYYHKVGNADSLKEYADEYIEYTYQVQKQSEADNIQRMSASYNYNRWKKEALRNEKAVEIKSYVITFLIIILTFVVLLSVVSAVFYRKYMLKKRLLDAEELRSLKQQIELKEIELQQKSDDYEKMCKEQNTMSADLSEKELQIIDLQEVLNILNDNFLKKLKEQPLKSERLSQKAIFLSFEKLTTTNVSPTTKQWKMLEDAFIVSFPGFMQVKEKGLTEMECRICMLVWLGFAPSQLKILMETSSSNISNIRSRMSEKIFGERMSASTFDKELKKMTF